MSDASKPLVVAFVLTWNDTEMTRACLQSVLDNDYPNLKVLLVDNGSDEPCGEQVVADFPEVELITLPENRGFTGGGNAGLKRALELKADYVQLIGNDSVLETDCIARLVEELERELTTGIASPLLLNAGKERTVQFYTGSLDRGTAWHDNHDWTVPVESRAWPTVESPFVPFVAPMFRCGLLETIGGLDETLSTCWEDFDLLVRALDEGWKARTVGAARAVHLGSQTTGTVSPYITYYHTRNRLICLIRHGGWGGALLRSFRIMRSFCWQIRAYGLGNWACHKAFCLGWLHFLLGIRGEGWKSKRRPKSA